MIVLKVTYELTPDDLWQYQLYYRRYKAPIPSVHLDSLIVKSGLVFVCLVLLLSAYVSLETLIKHHTFDWSIVGVFAVLAVAAVCFLHPSKRTLIQRGAKQPGIFCEHVHEICPEWTAHKTFVNESKMAWMAIFSIEENEAYLFLFLSKNAAYIIPKRAFTSYSEAQAFLDKSRRYWEAAKTGTPVAAEDEAVWPPAPRPGD